MFDMFGANKSNAQNQVNELAERLKTEAGLTDEQAQKTLESIKNFIVEKCKTNDVVWDRILGDKLSNFV
jgi:ribosomal protein L31E